MVFLHQNEFLLLSGLSIISRKIVFTEREGLEITFFIASWEILSSFATKFLISVSDFVFLSSFWFDSRAWIMGGIFAMSCWISCFNSLLIRPIYELIPGLVLIIVTAALASCWIVGTSSRTLSIIWLNTKYFLKKFSLPCFF